MTKEELKQKARDFVKEYLQDNLILDEDALVQFTTEATKELQEENEQLKRLIADSRKDGISPINALIIKNLSDQIEKMKADVKQGQSYWNSGEMQYDLYQRLLDKWEIKE